MVPPVEPCPKGHSKDTGNSQTIVDIVVEMWLNDLEKGLLHFNLPFSEAFTSCCSPINPLGVSERASVSLYRRKLNDICSPILSLLENISTLDKDQEPQVSQKISIGITKNLNEYEAQMKTKIERESTGLSVFFSVLNFHFEIFKEESDSFGILLSKLMEGRIKESFEAAEKLVFDVLLQKLEAKLKEEVPDSCLKGIADASLESKRAFRCFFERINSEIKENVAPSNKPVFQMIRRAIKENKDLLPLEMTENPFCMDQLAEFNPQETEKGLPEAKIDSTAAQMSKKIKENLKLFEEMVPKAEQTNRTIGLSKFLLHPSFTSKIVVNSAKKPTRPSPNQPAAKK